MNKKAALFPTVSLGDSLIFTIIADSLKEMGYEIDFYHDVFYQMSNWFKDYNFKKLEDLQDLETYDLVYFQNDDKKRTKEFIEKNKLLKTISIIYFRYKESKHGPLSSNDIALKGNEPIAKELLKIFQSKKNNLTIPDNLVFKKEKKRVIIHPSSGNIKKNYSKKKLLKFCRNIQKKGFEPVFTIAKNELINNEDLLKSGIKVMALESLSDFASYLYESSYLIGNDSFAGHLASYFNIPSITLAANQNLMKTWQPGWRKSYILLPPKWAPNLKGFRIKENRFSFFISVRKLISSFYQLVKQEELN